jgi:hypothetical protein
MPFTTTVSVVLDSALTVQAKPILAMVGRKNKINFEALANIVIPINKCICLLVVSG